MKRILFTFIVFASVFSLYSQEKDGLLIYRHKSRPLLVVLDEISNISHSDSIQILDLKPEWNIKVKTPVSSIDSMSFVDIDTLYNVKYACLSCPDDNHPHAIDLGLPSGTKWACCNVGSPEPKEIGEFYNWGMTRSTIDATDPYDFYEYIIAPVGEEMVVDIGDDISGTEYDVAHVKWGGSWRMPTSEQFQELFDNMWNYQISEIDNTPNSLIAYCTIYGPNGNCICFPCVGGYYTIEYDDETEKWYVVFREQYAPYYWTSTRSTILDSYDPDGTHRLVANCADLTRFRILPSQKFNSIQVRPVCP